MPSRIRRSSITRTLVELSLKPPNPSVPDVPTHTINADFDSAEHVESAPEIGILVGGAKFSPRRIACVANRARRAQRAKRAAAWKIIHDGPIVQTAEREAAPALYV